jgi:hypothetical protein
MRRTSDIIPTEPLVAIDVVAANVGQLPEIIWAKLKESDVRPDWNRAPSVTWTKARALYDEITAAKQANDEWNQANIARQMEDEHEGRMKPVREWERARDAEASRVKGIEVSLPGEPEPPWASAPSAEDDE